MTDYYLKAAVPFNIYLTYCEKDLLDMFFSSEQPGVNKQRKVY